MDDALGAAANDAPTSAGVYFFLGDAGTLLYVGKAGNLRRRLQQHALAAPTSSRYARLYDDVRAVRWEIARDETAAADREADLILALRPIHNVSLTEGRWQYIAVAPVGAEALSFTLSASCEGGTAYGCFPHLGGGLLSRVGNACADGYTALLRTLWAASPAGGSGARYPAPITKPAPPASFAVDVAAEMRGSVSRFFSGTGSRLLTELAARHARCEPYMRPALVKDLTAARAFYDAGPRAIRALRLRHGERSGPLTRARIEELLAREVQVVLAQR